MPLLPPVTIAVRFFSEPASFFILLFFPFSEKLLPEYIRQFFPAHLLETVLPLGRIFFRRLIQREVSLTVPDDTARHSVIPHDLRAFGTGNAAFGGIHLSVYGKVMRRIRIGKAASPEPHETAGSLFYIIRSRIRRELS
jgi:hypothetical protein